MMRFCFALTAFGILFPADVVVVADDVIAILPKADATEQINHFIATAWKDRGITPAEKCSDRTFVRRVYLDLAGRVPTVPEVEAFLADRGDDRRRRLVDLLLGSEDYVQHFADVFDTLLMGRADESKYAERVLHQWRSYLEDVFRSNRAWNDVVSEILLARPDGQHKRGAIWFLYERYDKYQTIAESVAPAFFGIRVECAQCHDHMVADEIKQEHYWGLVAFFNRGKNENTKNGPRVAESAIGGFSEFANLSGESRPNRLTFFDAVTVDEPRPGKDEKQQDKDDLYVPAGLEGDPRVPKFSRRQKFVEEIVTGHSLLPRALVNRVWAMLMARGIVHPYDEMDSVHQPSHPRLLDWLADDFAAGGFDIRRLVRSIALCDAYQLDSIQPQGADDPASFAWYLERPLTAEQMSRSVQLIVRGGYKTDDSIVGLFRQQFKDVLPDENVVTISDALFLSNNAALHEFLSAGSEPSHLVSRLTKLQLHSSRAALLLRTVFGREPDESEAARLTDYLRARQEKPEAALRHALWAMLTSAEFRFNH